MALAPGDRLGPYEILAPIGSGGMGQVYKASDTRLDRIVAIKVSKEQFSERFEREARAIAALNHPNICHLYDVGPNYLVMEFVDGSRVTPPGTPRKLLDIATQIADGMAAAHAADIVHRDLKPDNILLTSSQSDQPGRVKILDFGLARRSRNDQAREGSAAVRDVTRTMAITDPGTTVGTIAYMSPEQALGEQNLTSQSDQFAFGLVLYELAAGKRAFFRNSAAETMTAIIREDADPLPASVPAPFRWIVERLLSKDPSERYDSTRDLYRELRQFRDRLSEASSSAVGVPAPGKRRKRIRVLMTVALILAATVAGTWIRWNVTKPIEDRPLTRLGVDLGPDAEDNPRQSFAISADGTRIAFQSRTANGSQQISLLSLNQAKPVALPGTEGGTGPFFSPNGQWLGFQASRKLMKIRLDGGAPIVLAEVPSGINGESWGPDGNIVGNMDQTELGTQTGLSLVSDSGGVLHPLTRPAGGEATHRWPQYLPGGEYVLFTAHALLDDFDDASLEVVSVKTGRVKTVLRGGYYGRYLPSGHLVYLRDGILWGVRFDLGRLETRGPAKPLLDDVALSTSWGTGRFAFSQTGVFVYRKPVATAWSIVWMDSSGKTEPLLSTPKPYYTPRLSPDGRKLAVSEGGITRGNVVVYDLKRDKMTQITFDGQGHFGPVWTPDGMHVIYRSHYAATGEYTIDWDRADGSGEPRRLLTSKTALLPYSISSDGRCLAYIASKNAYDIWILPLDLSDPEHPKAGDPQPFLTGPANELEPMFSPDGRWIAYGSNETRRNRGVYVRPVTPVRDAPDRKWPITTGVGSTGYFPMWSHTGHELFYVDTAAYPIRSQGADNRIMVVSYTTAGDSFIAEAPRVWSPQPIFRTELFSSLDLSPDGKRFVTFQNPDQRDVQDAVSRLTVLQNFFDEVRRRISEGAK